MTSLEGPAGTSSSDPSLWSDGRNRDFSGFQVAPQLVGDDYAFSPDGSMVAFSDYVSEGAADGVKVEIFVMGADGSELTQVTHDDAYNAFPSWSPDGTEIVYTSYRGDEYIPGCLGTTLCPGNLFIVGVDGTNERQLTDAPSDESMPSWSPDGQTIVFQSAATDAAGTLRVIRADGIGERELVGGPGGWALHPKWAPDGERVLFLGATARGTVGVWIVGQDGTELHEVADTEADSPSGLPALWSPDGGEIAFSKLVGGEPQLWVANADGTDAHMLAELPRYGLRPVAWQPVPESSPSSRQVIPRVTATIPVGSFPRDIAVGTGAVWVSVIDFNAGGPERHSIVPIDPATNEIVATIPVGTAGNLAAGSDAVWMIDTVEGPQDTVLRIDPATNEVVAGITVGPYAFDVAVDSTGVWVTRDIDGRGQLGEVIRIDPATNEIAVRIPVDGRLRDVVVGEGGVWVVDSTSTLRREPSLVHVDPGSNEVVGRIPGLASLNVATGGGFVWIQGWLSTIDPAVGTGSGDRPLVLRIDPVTDRIVGDAVPLSFFYPFAFWDGGIWFVAEESTVSLLNAGTLEVEASIQVTAVAQDSTVHAAFDSATETIWVANYENTITRVDLG